MSQNEQIQELQALLNKNNTGANLSKEDLAKTLVCFNNDVLSAVVFLKKYALQDKQGHIYETTLDQAKNRWASTIAGMAQDKPISYYRSLFEFCLPGGRQMFAIGNPYFKNTTAVNCYTHQIKDDSLEGIFDTCYSIAKTFAWGGGQGVDLSVLRPRESMVSNASRSSTGAVSFGELFSQVTGIIGQNARRGALLECIDIKHPSVMEFITAKSKDNNTIRYANLSVKITDDFMRAVENNENWTLEFKSPHETISNTIKASELWNLIIKSAATKAEPGVLFWNTIKKLSASEIYQGHEIIGVNPCQPKWAEVLTPEGKKQFKDIGIGSIIKSRHGWVKVINKICTGTKEVYAYNTLNGIFYGTNNHIVLDRGNKIPVNKAKYIDTDRGPARIIRCRYISTEPVYSITVDHPDHTYITDNLHVGNCGEEPLPNHGVCCIASLILPRFIINPFTPEAEFDYKIFRDMVSRGVRYLDNVITFNAERHPLKEQCNISLEERRIGLGFTGLADLFAMMNLEYGSDESLDLLERILKVKCETEYLASINLAKEKGSFPIFKKEHYDQGFPATLPEHIKELGRKHGQRNIALSTVAPSGSLSIIAQCSSGIEPLYQTKYVRTVELGSQRKDFTVYHPGILHAAHVLNKNPDNIDIYNTAYNVDPQKRIKLQAITQKYIDAAISSTINLSEKITLNEISDIYMEAWKQGLKGITIYVNKSREGIFNEVGNKEKKSPHKLDTTVYKFKAEGGDKFYVHVSYKDAELTQPYHIFIVNYIAIEKDSFIKLANDLKKGLEEALIDIDDIQIQWDRGKSSLNRITRLISLGLKNNLLDDIIDILDKYAFIGTLASRLKYILLASTNKQDSCPECGEYSLIEENGCVICSNCGFSGCG